MQLTNTAERYGTIAKGFHWILLFAIAGLLAVGFIMEEMKLGPDKIKLIGIHKAVGILVLLTVILRLSWRLFSITPALDGSIPRWQGWLANAVHYALYAVMLFMPLSGWLMSSAAGFPVSLFGLFTLPDMIAPNHELHEVFEEAHEVTAFIIIGLVCAHAGAALYHHFIRKDNTLLKMLPFVKP